MSHQLSQPFRGDASVGILLVSWPALTILDCNAEAERLYGVSPGALQGTSVLSLSLQPEETRTMFDRAVINPRAATARRIHRRPDGSSFPVHVAFSVDRKPEATLVTKFVFDASSIIQRTCVSRFEIMGMAFQWNPPAIFTNPSSLRNTMLGDRGPGWDLRSRAVSS